jgi:hypothetical protein
MGKKKRGECKLKIESGKFGMYGRAGARPPPIRLDACVATETAKAKDLSF